MRSAIVPVCVIGLLAAFAPAANAVLDLEAIYWNMTPSGDATVGFEGAEGTEVDVADDLGYDSAQDVLGARLVAGERHQLEVSYFGLDLSADNTIDKTIRFSDVEYRARADVSSSLELTLIRGAYRFRGGSDLFGGGFLLGGQYVDVSASLSASGYGSAGESATVGMPVVGAFAEFAPVPFLKLVGNVAGGMWQWGDIEATYIDAEAAARLALGPVFAGIGYKYISVDGSDDSIPLDVNLVFEGPTAYAGFTF